MLFGAAPSRFNALNENVLRENPPDGGLGGGAGDLGAFPAGGSSLGGFCGRVRRVITASWAETWGACSQTVTMGAAFSASGLWWEAESPLRGGSGFSGGVSPKSPIHWQPAFCDTLPGKLAQPQARSLMVCVSRNFCNLRSSSIKN
jgi:hypothetical protein